MARTLGIDIHPTSIRAVLAFVGSRRFEVQRYFEVPLIASTSAAAKAETLRAAVAEIIEDIKPPPDRVVAALDGAHVSLRHLDLPTPTMKRAAEVIPFELEPLIPFDTDDVIIAHQPIRVDGAITRVMTATAPKTAIGEHLDFLASVGLEPRELAVGGVCLEGLAPLLTTDGNEPDGPVLLLNVEQTFTEFCTVENGRCTFARTLSEGVTDVATGRLEGALRRTMAAYRAAGGNVPTHGWLLGEGATDDHAPPWFTSKLDLPITPLALPEGPGAEAPTRPRFARAAALASYASIRSGRIDLRQKEFESKATDGFLQNHGGLLALAACAILISAGFSVAARWANLSSENQQLQARLESITETAFRKGTSNPEVARRLLDGKGGDEDPIPEFDAYDTLEMISSKIPPDIKHDVKKLTIELDDDGKEGRFELRGTVPSIAERDQVASLIGEHKCIHDLQKGTTSAAPGGAGVSYPLEATIRCSPEDPDTKKKKKKK